MTAQKVEEKLDPNTVCPHRPGILGLHAERVKLRDFSDGELNESLEETLQDHVHVSATEGIRYQARLLSSRDS